ncbi:RagB/SusD family nutrient uptake outer membrane protein [Chitinophaga pendula]|uniref:RagB/SusD family nutrient uptake outer membrane protein n=1 Tax=Chitinophaga TaxID=79328 RepID=UPI0018DFF167|nr:MULTISPECIES: RagB/SusD family nutrient uptake outer membrane protein [Chitinophaga]UCJ06535.1 RagB/SusD family nutrient uptake outer membrane protein [Chitinophaga pendula]
MKAGFKYLSYILLGATIAAAVACNKKLDVLPGAQITPDQIRNGDDVKATLAGGYSSLQNASAYGEQYLSVPELLANTNIRWVGTFATYRDVALKQQVVTLALATDIWNRGYKTINTMNLVLSKLNLLSAAEQAVIGGEAKFLRAITYFELAGMFGKPYSAGNITTNVTVPIVLTPIISDDQVPAGTQPRASVDDLYKQVISDLKDAAATLPAGNGVKANKFSAFAFLARVYLAQGNYALAAASADSVISKGGFSLTSSFDKEFNNAGVWSSEDIFAIIQNAQSNAGTTNNGLVTFFAPKPFGRGDIAVQPSQLALYDDGDARKEYYQANAQNTIFYTKKWSVLYGTIPVVRLAEMYLTRAEANLQNNSSIGATPLDDVNRVRDRSKAGILSAVTVNDVVAERERELAFEGDLFRTVKRLKKNVGNRPYDDNKLVLPVPQRERDVNPKLSQNPGY